MKSTKELSAEIRRAMKESGVSQEALASHLGFPHHTAVTRRLSGQTPWTYDEINRVAELFNLAGEAIGPHSTSPPQDPAIRILNEILLALTPQDRWDVLYAAGLIAEAKTKRPQTKKQAKTLLHLAQKHAMRGRKP